MTVQVERLVAVLEARIDKYEKNLEKASRQTDRQFTKIERRGRAMEKALSAQLAKVSGGMFRGLATGAAAALAPILSVTAALDGARDAVATFDRIAKSAKNAGLDSDFYQELGYAAELAGVGIDGLDQALTSFIRNAGLAATGQGELFSSLKELNPEVLKAIKNARSQEDRIRAMADAIQGATSASEKAALAAAAFGDQGTRLVEALKNGSAGLDDVARKAQNLGIVIDRDLLKKSEDLSDELATANRVMDAEFKKTLIELAPILISTARFVGDVASAINDVVDAMRDMENRSTDTLRMQLREQTKFLDNNPNVKFLDVEKERGKLKEIEAELKRRALDQLRIDLRRQKRNLRDGLGGGGRDDDTGTGGGGGGGTRNDAARNTLQQAQAVRDLINELEFESSLIGKSALEQEKMNALRRAGGAATAEQRELILQKIEANYREREAVNQAALAHERLADVGRDALGGIINDLRNGVDASEALANALTRVADTLLHEVLEAMFRVRDAGGGGGGFLTTILGNLFGGQGSFPPAPGASVGLLHGGGLAGSTAHQRQVSPGMFAAAQRYHTGGIAGLGPDEVPAILRRGETVLPVGGSQNIASQTSKVQILLGPGLVGEVLEQAGAQTIQIIETGNTERVASGVIDARVRGFAGV